MKKVLFFIGLSAAVLFATLFLPATTFDGPKAYFILEEGENNTKGAAAKMEGLVRYRWALNLMGGLLSVDAHLKPGKFELKQGQNILSIIRQLRNNKQAEIKLIVTKLRTKMDLARLISKNFKADSTEVMQFLQSNDSLKAFGVDTNTAMTLVIPNTYSFYWNTPLQNIFKKLAAEKDAFWNKDNRKEKAAKLGYTPEQVYTLASIVEEETIRDDEKGNIASVYLNRLRIGMEMGADPTIKFALNDFSIKRILEKHLNVQSPYNTYRNTGLPPGPICTPSIVTIDATLNAPKTDYLFCCAKADFSGYHNFAATYEQHLKYADEYQQELNRIAKAKAQSSAK
jgi:UPF0755 protein